MRLSLVILIIISISLLPLALSAQQKFVFSDEPFLSPVYKSIQARQILIKYFNYSDKEYLYVIINGSYNASLNVLNKLVKQINGSLYTPYDVLNSTNLTYFKYIKPIYENLKKYNELYLKLKSLKNYYLNNFSLFMGELYVTYGIPLGIVNPNINNYTKEFYNLYIAYLKNNSEIDSARKASIEVFNNPFVIYFSFNNFTNSTLAYTFLNNFRNYSDLIYRISGIKVPEEAIENPLKYIESQIPPPPITINNFHLGNYWLFIIEVPPNTPLSAISNFSRQIRNGYVTGPLAVYSDSETYTSESLKTIDIITVSLIGLLLILLLRAIIPILILIISAALGLEIAYSITFIESFIGYQPYYISGLVITPIVFGISVDYAILFLYRYFEELNNNDKERALEIAFKRTARAVILSGMSITIGFISFIISGSPLLSNVGVGLVNSSISALIASIFVPYSLLKIVDPKILNFPRKSLPNPSDIRQEYLGETSAWAIKNKYLVLLISILIIFISLYIIYNYNTNLSVYEILPKEASSVGGLEILSKMYNFSLDYVIGQSNISKQNILNLTKYLISKGALVYGPFSLGTKIINNSNNEFERGNYILLEVYLPYPTFSDNAINLTAYIFQKGFLVAGSNAERYDIVKSTEDLYYNLTLPLTIFLITIYMFLILQSIIMPIRLAFTIFLSSLSSLALTYLVFKELYWLTPLVIIALMFSLGIDYDLFIILRMLEEKSEKDEDRIVKAISKTGLVVTTAGLILAGAFLSLTFSQMRFLQEIGFGIGISVLIDTFIVRPLLVPSILSILGKYNWWPRKVRNF
jgi:RND superfamily putative drug exporter